MPRISHSNIACVKFIILLTSDILRYGMTVGLKGLFWDAKISYMKKNNNLPKHQSGLEMTTLKKFEIMWNCSHGIDLYIIV
jgi:hypothetical protein